MIYKRTKIVATIGPASSSPVIIKALIKAGLNVTRLNFSHGTYEERHQQIQDIRRISQELDKPVAIMADLQGPKLRLGTLAQPRRISKGEVISFSVQATGDEVPIQFDLSSYLKPDERVFIDDGLVEFKVIKIIKKTIQVKAQNNGVISSNKGINIPDTLMKNTAFTPKDEKDLKFILKEDVDFVALSFIQTAQDLKPARDLINRAKSRIQIVSKIEKKMALDNLSQIMHATDAVMVARGDLGIETRASQVPLAQQKIINLARQFQKPVIVATQMLESMVNNPRPTRAEASDVAHAVLSQVDAVMLSAESASGKYPVEAVSTMNEIILSVEEQKEYQDLIQINWQSIPQYLQPVSALMSSAAILAHRLNAKAIIAATATGRTARILASFRPEAQIVAMTYDEKVRNQLQLAWGIKCFMTKFTTSYDEFWKEITDSIEENRITAKGDRIIIISGSLIGVSGKTDTIKVVTV